MNTEITDKEKSNGWVFYDAGCDFCTALAERFHAPLARRHFELLPLQTPWVRAKLGLADAELLAEMRVLNPRGEIFGGADALLEISRHFWWTWPVRLISRVPPVRKLFRACYRWIARHRHCAGGVCRFGNLKPSSKIPFSEEQIQNGLPPAGPFRSYDIRCCQCLNRAKRTIHRVFFEMP